MNSSHDIQRRDTTSLSIVVIKHLTRLLLKQWERLPKSQITRTPRKTGLARGLPVRQIFIGVHLVLGRTCLRIAPKEANRNKEIYQYKEVELHIPTAN